MIHLSCSIQPSKFGPPDSEAFWIFSIKFKRAPHCVSDEQNWHLMHRDSPMSDSNSMSDWAPLSPDLLLLEVTCLHSETKNRWPPSLVAVVSLIWKTVANRRWVSLKLNIWKMAAIPAKIIKEASLPNPRSDICSASQQERHNFWIQICKVLIWQKKQLWSVSSLYIWVSSLWCASGEIGRRTSLRGWRPQGRAGSSPVSRTILLFLSDLLT